MVPNTLIGQLTETPKTVLYEAKKRKRMIKRLNDLPGNFEQCEFLGYF